jgi:glutathione S-transferase
MIARLALVERGVPFASVKVDIHRRTQQLAPEYARINPNLTVPTLEVDGRVVSQSRDILLFAFDTTDAALDEATRAWVDRHYAFPIEELTFGRLLSWSPLARMGFVRFDAEIARRAHLARYMKAAKARPSFREADIWDRLSPLKLLKQVL